MTPRPWAAGGAAREQDVHAAALAMPHVTVQRGKQRGTAIYQVGGKSFVFFRTPRPDACDPVTGWPTGDWSADVRGPRSRL